MFGKDGKTKEEKAAEKAAKVLRKYGVEDMPAEYQSAVNQIAQELIGMGSIEAGMKLSFANAADQATVSYLHAIFMQNWIIIRELREIADRK